MGRPAILVVDDDGDVRSMVCLVLTGEGYAASGAPDGLAALECLRTSTEPPALILVDLMMPRMDGEALVQALAAEPSLARIPVVIISGQGTNEPPKASPQVIARVRKPIELDELLDLVRQVAGVP